MSAETKSHQKYLKFNIFVVLVVNLSESVKIIMQM